MYSNDKEQRKEDLFIFDEIIKKSLFTRKQISIIYNKLNGVKIDESISSGAYYRQVKQCRNKIHSLLYTILLFKILKLIDDRTFGIIESIVEKLQSLSQEENNHINDPLPQDVINVIDRIIKKTLSV